MSGDADIARLGALIGDRARAGAARGRLGVAIMRGLIDQGALAGGDGRFCPSRTVRDRLSAPGSDVNYYLTQYGHDWVRRFGIDVDGRSALRRRLIRYCTDWSEQHHHLAGALGADALGISLPC